MRAFRLTALAGGMTTGAIYADVPIAMASSVKSLKRVSLCASKCC